MSDAPLWQKHRGEVIGFHRTHGLMPPVVISLSVGVAALCTNVVRQLGVKVSDSEKEIENPQAVVLTAIESLRSFAPLPADSCWLEYHNEAGETFAYWIRPTSDGHEFCFISSEYMSPAVSLDTPPVIKDVISLWLDILSASAVLATPGVRTTESNKTDARSIARGVPRRYAEITHRTVEVNLDVLGEIPERGQPNIGGGSPKAMHHVRGHLRLTEKGLVPVRAHWRGSIEHGLRLKDINYKRDEECRP